MGKNIALAVVTGARDVLVIDATRPAGPATGNVTPAMVRDFIQKDLARYPDLGADVAAIEDILILSDEHISSDSYAQDMTQCYVRRMRSGGWAAPRGLHIFETLLGPLRVYIAYGTN